MGNYLSKDNNLWLYRAKSFREIVGMAIVMFLAAGCGFLVNNKPPAACLSDNPGSQSGLTPAPRGGGKCIAFSAANEKQSEFYLSVMLADGSGAARLSKSTDVDLDPDWSPDGKHIAFTSNVIRSGFDIFTMDADGSNRIQLAFSFFIEDGATGHNEIYVMAADGSNPVRLTNDPVNKTHPALQP